MRVFKDVGLVEQLGSGMSRILKAYDKSIFQISEHFIRVVFPVDRGSKNLDEPANEPIKLSLSDSEKRFLR